MFNRGFPVKNTLRTAITECCYCFRGGKVRSKTLVFEEKLRLYRKGSAEMFVRGALWVMKISGGAAYQMSSLCNGLLHTYFGTISK